MGDEVADFVHCPNCGLYTVPPCTCEAVEDAPKPKKRAKKAEAEAPAADPAPEAPPAE